MHGECAYDTHHCRVSGSADDNSASRGVHPIFNNWSVHEWLPSKGRAQRDELRQSGGWSAPRGKETEQRKYRGSPVPNIVSISSVGNGASHGRERFSASENGMNSSSVYSLELPCISALHSRPRRRSKIRMGAANLAEATGISGAPPRRADRVLKAATGWLAKLPIQTRTSLTFSHSESSSGSARIFSPWI